MKRDRVAPPKPIVPGRRRDPDPKSTAELRECPQHGLAVFHRYGQAQPRWKCKRCVGEAVTRRHQKVKRILVAEAGGACCVCGYSRCMFTLHFHHVDPAEKSFAVTMARGKSLAAFREEAKKCVLVCANCHGEIEAGLRPSPPIGSRWSSRGTAVWNGVLTPWKKVAP
jgi:hypothetical protein